MGAFLKQIYDARLTLIATFAFTMSLQHLMKMFVFGQTGFDITPWLIPVMTMILAGMVGTWVGLRISTNLNDKTYHKVFNIILTLLALRLMWQALV